MTVAVPRVKKLIWSFLVLVHSSCEVTQCLGVVPGEGLSLVIEFLPELCCRAWQKSENQNISYVVLKYTHFIRQPSCGCLDSN
ncbi:MAG TPA: hypothetical protein DIW81_30280 [Planctomycetaceae bacterium]|nr:hypothetical protein [Planctomycetaceae bacterium]